MEVATFVLLITVAAQMLVLLRIVDRAMKLQYRVDRLEAQMVEHWNVLGELNVHIRRWRRRLGRFLTRMRRSLESMGPKMDTIEKYLSLEPGLAMEDAAERGALLTR